MRKISKLEIRISIIVIVLAIVFFFVSGPSTLNYLQKENLNYKLVASSDKISGRIIGVYEDKGFSFVTFSDSIKLCFQHSRNFSYKNPYLSPFMLIGDSIVKQINSDTLRIYRSDSSYYFVLGKFINQKK